MTTLPIIIEQLYNSPVNAVWEAITDKDEMRKWYFDLEEFKAETGFKFEFTGGPSPERQYVHQCEITEVIPQKKITYSWKYKGFDGISLVTFELMPEGEDTLLRLTHSGLESFPQDNPDFSQSNFIEGWEQIIKSALKEYLES